MMAMRLLKKENVDYLYAQVERRENGWQIEYSLQKIKFGGKNRSSQRGRDDIRET